MTIEQHEPLHPGEFIKKVYLEPFSIGSNELSRKLGVSAGLVSRLLRGQSEVSTAMALRLSKVLGRSPESWLLMQGNYNLWKEKARVDFSKLEPFDFDQIQTA